MASAAAQAFFDKQSPQDRMAIIDSWGGADLMDEWYNNAKAAGSVPAAGAAAPAAASVPTAAQIRAAAVGQSEDFGRFSDAQIEAWAPSYDAAASAAAGRPQYRSEGGGGALVDKPTECPSGTTLHGSKCISYEQANSLFGGGYGGVPEGAYSGPGGAGAAAGAKPAYFGQDDPLQRMLTNNLASGAGTFAGSQTGGQFQGGGVFSQGAGQITPQGPATANPAATAALAALPGTSAIAASPAPAVSSTGVLGQAAPVATPVATPVAAPVAAPAFGSAPSAQPQSNIFGSVMQAVAPLAATSSAIKQPDAFGVQPGTGSFEDLIKPRLNRKDARLGGNWF